MNETATDHSLFTPALRGIFAALGSDAVQKVLGFLATLIVLRSLAPYDYGLWQLVLSVLTAFDVIILPSIASMLIADISREIGARRKNRAGAIVARAVPASILLGLVGASLMFFGAPYVTHSSGIDLTFLLRIMSFSLIVDSTLQAYQLVLQGTIQLVHAQTIKILKRLSYVLAVCVLLLGANLGLTGVAYAYVISLLLPVLLYAPVIIPRFNALIFGREGGHGHFLEAAWVRGRWVFAGDVAVSGSASAWPWIVGYFLSVTEIGYISLAITILSHVTSLAPISFVLRSVLPRTLGIEGRTRAWLARSMKYAIWSQMAGGIVTIGVISLAIPLFFPQYVPVIALTAALILSLPIRAVGVVASEWFFAAKRQKALFFISSLPKVLLLGLLPPLLTFFGMFGYALWYLFSADILTYLRLRLVAKDIGGHIPIAEILFPDREDGILAARAIELTRTKLKYVKHST